MPAAVSSGGDPNEKIITDDRRAVLGFGVSSRPSGKAKGIGEKEEADLGSDTEAKLVWFW